MMIIRLTFNKFRSRPREIDCEPIKELTLEDMKILWDIERWLNENTNTRIHISLEEKK